MDVNRDRRTISEKPAAGVVAKYLRHLAYVLEKPTPLSVKENTHLTDLSILKQCLLF